MPEVGAVAGTKLYIGGTATIIPSPDVASPDIWTEIGNISNLGSVMTQFAKIAVESVGDGYTRQIKGTQSSPELALVLNRKDDDPGQLLVKAANNDRNTKYNFKVVENDLPIGGTVATTTVFKGRVYGFGSTYGGVNDLKKVNTSIEIEPDTIVVSPAA